MAKTTQVTMLVRFWAEDGVWNGEAKDLPVAVFGDTFEEAQTRLREAVMAHLMAVAELGLMSETIAQLQAAEEERYSLFDAEIDELFSRISAPIPQLQNCHA